MALQFKKATKEKFKLRMALYGPPGSGKTYSALAIAKAMGGNVAVIDTERGSASKYADLFEFDVLEPDRFAPQVFIEAIEAAEKAGYDILVIDSLSHAWMGKGGVLEQHDAATLQEPGRNSYTAWRHVTPMHHRLIDAMLQCDMHVIACMRSKSAYVMDQDKGKIKSVTKVGLEPVQREGVEYEFDVVGDMNMENNMHVVKTRCAPLKAAFPESIVPLPGENIATVLMAWLSDGATPTEKKSVSDNSITTASLKNLPRPWPADVVVMALQHQAEEVEGLNKQPDEGAFGACIGIMEKTGDRNRFTLAVFGHSSTKDLTPFQRRALTDWIKPSKDEPTGEWIPAQFFSAEFNAVVEARLAEEGQETLLEDEDAEKKGTF